MCLLFFLCVCAAVVAVCLLRVSFLSVCLLFLFMCVAFVKRVCLSLFGCVFVWASWGFVFLSAAVVFFLCLCCLLV